ncbi:hypothetical protein [Corynebacterium mayonis]|uniref:hypothetical protein n=1 Tax=Corynebacterium mayonis TaxID=3062461 RepID=UPI0031408340
MSDSFSQFRPERSTERKWVAVAAGFLSLAVVAAAAAAIWAVTRPAEERRALPQTVTVTAQPSQAGQPISPEGTIEPGTYTGWMTARSQKGESGWRVALTITHDSAMLAFLNDRCTTLLTPSDEDTWETKTLNKFCGPVDGAWELTQPEPGVVEAELVSSANQRVQGVLSRELNTQ